MEIKDPKFDLYEFVTLHWNSQTFPGRVVKRWFDADDESWWYVLTGGPPEFWNPYPESALEGVRDAP